MEYIFLEECVELKCIVVVFGKRLATAFMIIAQQIL